MATTAEACIKYESVFDRTKMSTVSLAQRFVDGNDHYTVKKDCPTFDGTGGVEALLFVESEFRKTVRKLQLEGADVFDAFDEVVVSPEHEKWDMLVRNIAAAQRTNARFNIEFDNFLLMHCPEDARDGMVNYLNSNETRKPRNTSPDDHFNRMEQLFAYTNRLPAGVEPQLTNNQQKQRLLASFPEAWVEEYQRNHRVEDDTKAEILHFMREERRRRDRADKRAEDRRKRNGNNSNGQDRNVRGRGRGGRYNNGGRGNGGRGGRSGSNRNSGDQNWCRIEGHDHLWRDCPNNSRNRSNNSNNNHQNRGQSNNRGGRNGRGNSNNNYRNNNRGQGGNGYNNGGNYQNNNSGGNYNQGGNQGNHYQQQEQYFTNLPLTPHTQMMAPNGQLLLPSYNSNSGGSRNGSGEAHHIEHLFQTATSGSRGFNWNPNAGRWT